LILNQLSYLLIDNDLTNQKIFTLLIEQEIGSMQFYRFEDSENIEQRLNELPSIPNVVFLNPVLSPQNGFDLLRLIRTMESYQKTKVVAVTSLVMTENVAQMKQAGFDGLISKPIIPYFFSKLLQRIVEGESLWYIA
jgi:CheY-like chemotaxis protein